MLISGMVFWYAGQYSSFVVIVVANIIVAVAVAVAVVVAV